MNYIEYFNNLTEFKYKKDIINDIFLIYNKKLTDNEYKLLISNLIENNIISKSSNNNKCGFISISFLNNNNFLNGIEYYNKISLIQLNKNTIPFNKEDSIIEIPLGDLYV